MTITAEEVKAMAELLVWLRKAPRGEIEFTLEGRKSVIRPDYILADHADLLDRLSAQAQGSGTPFAYAYEYPTYDGPVIRFETNGREINGSKPTRAIPLYTHPSAGPAVSGPSVEDIERQTIERCAKIAEAFSRDWSEMSDIDGLIADNAADETRNAIASAIRSLTQTGEK